VARNELVDATFEYFWTGLAGIIVGPPSQAATEAIHLPH
jgi:hypothetical protein